MLSASSKNLVGTASVMSNVIYSAMQPNFTQDYSKDNIEVSAIPTNSKSTYNNNVYFRDPLSNAYVQVGLSDENLNRLQNVFGRDSIKQDNSGNVLLKGEAEKFVSGWFSDIAYKRGYIQADANQDGYLSIEEKQQLTAGYGLGAMLQGNTIKPGEFITYAKASEFGDGDASKFASSIEEALNNTLEDDSNADGKITINERMTLEDIAKYLSDLISSGSENGGYVPPSFDEFFGFLKAMDNSNKKMLKEELKKAGIDTKDISADMSVKEILQKLVESKADVKGFLEELKESLETESLTQETLNADSMDSTFQQIQDLTKLDKETLERNLENNPNFEDAIISIVQDIVKSVDAKYSKNTLIKTSLEINA